MRSCIPTRYAAPAVATFPRARSLNWTDAAGSCSGRLGMSFYFEFTFITYLRINTNV
jgi:hypothetical protein